MEALGPALKPGGAMIATVERLSEEQGSGCAIGPSGRYAHAEAYVRAAVEHAGLALASTERVTLRKELDRDVPGLLFMVINPAA